MRDYELVVIVNPTIPDDGVPEVTEQIGQWIGAGGGEVTNVNPWGRRRLAYPIKDFRDGTYVATRFRMSPQSTLELERLLKLSDDVLRYLLVKIGS